MTGHTVSRGVMIAILASLLLMPAAWAQQAKSGGTLRAGEVDFANWVPREHMERLQRDPQISVLRGKDTQRIAAAFNLCKPAFQDVRVRRAVLGYGIDRPIFLRRLTRDWDQFVLNTGAAIDPHTISRGIDTRAGNNTINHDDKHVDTLIDRMREAATEEAFRRAGYDFQRYVVENLMATAVSSYAFLQAARTYVKGYENLHGYKLRFETTWLEK